MTKSQLKEYKKDNQERKAFLLKLNFPSVKGGYPGMILGGYIQDGKYTKK